MIRLGFTRPASKLRASIKEAESMGFEVLAAPSMDILHGVPSEFSRLKGSLRPGTPVIFGSTTAADHCSQEFDDGFPGLFEHCTVIAIGPGTERRLQELGVKVDLIPDDYSSYGLLALIKGRYDSGDVVLIRSDNGTDIISQGLADSGLNVIDIAVYRLVAAEADDDMMKILSSIENKDLDWMALTSPMSASTFFDRMKEQFGEDYLKMARDNIKIAAIGRPTAEMLASLGRTPDLIPEKTTFHDLLCSIKETETL